MSGGPQSGMLGELLGDLGAQINLWSAIQGLIPQLKLIEERPVPKKLKDSKRQKKGKSDSKHEKKQERREDARSKAQSFNDSRKDAFETLDDEAREIPHIITGLMYDMMEIQNAQNQNAILGTQLANQQRYSAFTQFAGNLAGALGMPFGGTSRVLGALTPPSPGYQLPGTGLAAGTPGSMSSVESASGSFGGGGVVINNTFATAPSDPHTWSQQMAFEVAAL
jgi:hypothetical protein